MAAAAYRSGLLLVDDRVGEVADYSRRRGVLRDQALMVLPIGSPSWTRNELWNAAEAAENRKNSTVAREVEMSLPAELDQADRIALAHDFGRHLCHRYGCAADVQIHEPIRGDDARNFHTHILLSTRVLGPDGFKEKTRILDDKKTGPLEVEEMRREWASRVNAALESHGVAERIDHRSNARRGIDAPPTIHQGRGVNAASRAEYNDSVKNINIQLQELLSERARLVVSETVELARRGVVERPKALDAFKTFDALDLKNSALRSEQKADQPRRVISKIEPVHKKLCAVIQHRVELSSPGLPPYKDPVETARATVFAKAKELHSLLSRITGEGRPTAAPNWASARPVAAKLLQLKEWAEEVEEKSRKKADNSLERRWFVRPRRNKGLADQEASMQQVMKAVRSLLEFLFGGKDCSADPAVARAQQQTELERSDQLERRLAFARGLPPIVPKPTFDKPLPIEYQLGADQPASIRSPKVRPR